MQTFARIMPVSALCAAFLVLLFAGNPLANASENPGSLVLLLGSDSVRQELQVSTQQAAILDSLRQEYRQQAQSLVNKAPTNPEEAGNSVLALNALDDRFNRRALAVLNPSQQERLRAIEHTVAGGLMLRAPSVQESLNLTPSQIRKIDSLWQKLENTNRRLTQQAETGKITPARRLNMLRAERQKTAAGMEAVLNPQQLSAFVGMRKQN
jgi:hypothetical protein